MSAREPVLLVGAGGLARETVEAMRAGERYDPVGYLDDDTAVHGTSRLGVPVLGSVASAIDHELSLVLCPGRGQVRLRLEAALLASGLPEHRFATVVHPGASVPASAQIGPGGVLLAGAVLTADVRLGRHVVLMPNVVLTHDDALADGVTVCAGAVLNGSVHVGEAAYLGAASVVRENLTIGAGAVVGQGAVVLRNVPDGEVWVGSPARRLA